MGYSKIFQLLMPLIFLGSLSKGHKKKSLRSYNFVDRRHGTKKSPLLMVNNAPLAQLDRASVFETEGYRFESCKAFY